MGSSSCFGGLAVHGCTHTAWPLWGRGRSANSVSDRSVQSLYLWQSAVASAWYEALSIFEPVLRNRIDCELRKWNQAQGNSEDWLEDPAQPLKKAVSRMASDARSAAESSARRRPRNHPRFSAPITLDDRISQLSFGNISSLFVFNPCAARARGSTPRTRAAPARG